MRYPTGLTGTRQLIYIKRATNKNVTE
uniref:Uncharacterized protein n=1 Tax=Anguilla anguilla TaxID=7936 RepID=A0A0E9W4S5_ANGAN